MSDPRIEVILKMQKIKEKKLGGGGGGLGDVNQELKLF